MEMHLDFLYIYIYGLSGLLSGLTLGFNLDLIPFFSRIHSRESPKKSVENFYIYQVEIQKQVPQLFPQLVQLTLHNIFTNFFYLICSQLPLDNLGDF